MNDPLGFSTLADGASRRMPTFLSRRSVPASFAAELADARRPNGRGATPVARREAGAAAVRSAAPRVIEPPKRSAPEVRSERGGRDSGQPSGAVDAADAGPWADLINRTAKKHNVDPALVAAVARAESNFNPRAVSHAGAQGLMQLMPGTARQLGVEDSFDPAQNVDGGTRFLGEMLKHFKKPELALAAYNAGPNAVKKHGGIPPFKETQIYVDRVLKYHREIKAG